MSKLSKRLPDDYAAFLADVKERVRSAQYEALKVVNKELVALYWDIGRLIVERQDREGWGKSVVERLANDLRNEFPGVKGFSVQNLWYMRKFYLEYRDNEKLQPLVGEIGWSRRRGCSTGSGSSTSASPATNTSKLKTACRRGGRRIRSPRISNSSEE